MLRDLMKGIRGFTLVELLMVCAVTGVIVSIAIPKWQTAQNNYRVAAAADQLVSEIQTARLLAVSRDATLELVLNANGSYQVIDPVDPSTPPRAAKALPAGVTFQLMPAQPLVLFARGNAQGGTIRVGDATFSRQITVSAAGKVTVT